MAFVFMDLIYCNDTVSIVILSFFLLISFLKKMCKWLHAALRLPSIGIKLIPLVVSTSATGKNVRLSLAEFLCLNLEGNSAYHKAREARVSCVVKNEFM